MPHTKSSKKDLLRIQVRNERNRALRSRLRTFVKKARTAICSDPAIPATADSLKAAISQLDRMVTKGIIHKNQASRKKSRLVAAKKKAELAASGS
ncbi:MAG: 30S ribosomal protein S20 [bacterium]|nr:30S ribosomal protein S20 [bacterium]